MTDEQDATLTALVGELARAVDPLRSALSSPATARDYLAELGWRVTTDPPAPVLRLAQLAADLVDVAADGLTLSDVPTVAAKLGQLVTAIDAIAGVPLVQLPVEDPAAFATQFPLQLLQSVLGAHLLTQHATTASVLRLLGVLVIEDVDATVTRPAYRRSELVLADLPRLVSDPAALMTQALGWGQDRLHIAPLLDAAAALAGGLGLQARMAQVPPPVRELFSGGDPALDNVYAFLLHVLLLEVDPGRTDVARASLNLAPIPALGSLRPGLALLPSLSARLGLELELAPGVDLVLEADAALVEGRIGIVVRPDVGVTILGDLTAAATRTAAATLGITVRSDDGSPLVLLGSSPGSRVQFQSFSVSAGARRGAGDTSSLFVRLKLTDSALVVAPAPGESDSFLGSLLPREGFRLAFDLDVTLDSRSGLSLTGGAGLRLRYPTHVTVGPVDLTGLTLGLAAAGSGLRLDAGADLTGRLGPLKALVEGVGFTARLDLAARGGNLGAADLVLGFRAPTGVGLSIDTGVVRGGGFLSFDVEKGEYAGALELSLAGFIAVKAIAVITTRLPDGSGVFSLLVILTAEFSPGLQLGFGFTLLGVGGLLGLNRSVRLDALAQGIRTGAAESVLFPRNPVANAPRILSDLRAMFPQRQGTFLIGPMVKLGWGTPTLVSLSLGVIIEVPGNIAILGVLTVALPSIDAPLLQLKVSFLGAVEFDTKRVWFFASLFDSRVLVFPIDGELGLLMAFGDNASFLLSVGGFHPQFTPPPLPFPSPQRVGISILQGPGQRITASAYFAVTSNTVQFGARAELLLGFDSFGLQGHLSFDALFRFSPFSFVIDASASLSLKAFGVGVFSVRVDLTLEGPAPWRAHGRGSISLFFFDISADFDLTWGESRNTLEPPIAVLPLTVAELSKTEGWTAQLPVGASLSVTLRTLVEADGLVLHPLGALHVRQRALPLALHLDTIGARRPGDVTRVDIDTVSGGLTTRAPTRDEFALAQFVALDDAAKLSRRPFEPQDSGVVLGAGGSGFAATRAVARTVRYEQIVIDTFYQRFRRPFVRLSFGLFTTLLAGNAATLSAASASRARDAGAGGERIEVDVPEFVVAFTATNAARDAGARFASEAAARDHLATTVAAEPALAAALHVIPAFEETRV